MAIFSTCFLILDCMMDLMIALRSSRSGLMIVDLWDWKPQ
ncbi:hypothetical protein X766_21780 [Mesorhizobium sp. LSJC255A00]|nr:hypothetical protein X766_21780 [Mesorhizobium sp. LSJC255A00]